MNTTPTDVFVPKKERRTQFRGRSIETGEWTFGYLVVSENTHTIWKDGVCDDGRTSLFGYDVNEETVCQSTGVYDSKGSLIYEGDIVRGKYLCDSSNSLLNEPVEVTFIAKIIFECGAFCAKCISGHLHLSNCRSLIALECMSIKYEIIGNIHDDKELIYE